MTLVQGTNTGFVTVAPTSDPAESSTSMSNYAQGTRDTTDTTNLHVIEIGWWSSNTTPEANFEVGIYEDNGSNYPGDAVTPLYRTNALGTTPGWKTVAVDINLSSETLYWVVVQCDTGILIATDYKTCISSLY